MAILRRLGEKKFKESDGRTQKVLSRIDDTERVQRMLDAILEVSSWRELLAIR